MNRNPYQIKNKALLIFDVCGRPRTVESNEVEAKKVTIRIRKEQDCNLVLTGDKVCYRITVYNDSCVDLYDLDFRDCLQEGIEYQRNSFKVNGEAKPVEISCRSLCYHIRELKAKEELCFSFDAEVK